MSSRPTVKRPEQSTLARQDFTQLAGANWRRLVRPFGLVALLALVVIAVNLLALRLSPSGYTLDIGSREDRAVVFGFHGPERDQAGTSYRWSNGDAALLLRGPPSVGTTLVAFTLGGLPTDAAAPRALGLSVNEQPWVNLAVTAQPRRYWLLLPPAALTDGVVELGMRSENTVSRHDARPLGVRVDSAELRWDGGGWSLPVPLLLIAQLGLGLVWVVIAHWLKLGPSVTVGVTAVLIGAMAAYTALVPTLADPWLVQTFAAGLVSGAVMWGASRLLPQVAPAASAKFTRALLLITLIALMVRLMGVLFPLFFSHDLLVNSGRLRNVQFGELTLFDSPSEFSRRVIIVSPTAFILALPGSLLGSRGLALQGLYALLDGTTPLLMAVLARRLGLSERAALVAAGLIALLPMLLTALYWGFVKQIVCQWLTLLALMVVAGPTPQRRLSWLAATTLWVLTFLIHPGGVLLAGGAIGLYLLAGLWPQMRELAGGRVPLRLALAGPALRHWRGWLLSIGAAALVALALQYVDAARLMLGSLLANSPASAGSTTQFSYATLFRPYIWIGLKASFDPLPLALVGLGLGFLLWRTRGRARLLVGAWLGSALSFLVIEMITGQQIRYGYFVAPLVCAGVAALLEPLLPRRLGLSVAWALVALVALAGLTLWSGAIFAGIKPSVNPLTH